MEKIDLVVLDFDGVLTDNRVYVFEDGREAVACNRADGIGIELLKNSGIQVVILSTESNPVVSARARKLNVDCVQDCKNKATTLRELINSRGISLERVMYVGNDINDLEAMKLVGMPVAPRDARPEVKAIATTITASKGGRGVVREIADRLVSNRVA